MNFPLRFLLVLMFLSSVLRAEPLASSEAQALLRLATKPEKIVGSFIAESTVPTKRGTRSVTILTKYYPDGTSAYRKVQVDTPSKAGRSVRTQITVKNAAGVWDLSGDQAILMPPLFSQEKLAQAMEEVRAARAAGKEPDFDKIFAADPLLLQCIKVARHISWTGERLTVEARPCVSVVEVLDKEGQKVLEKLVKEQIAEVKKSLPFMVRVIATPMLASMDFSATLPVRTEHLIDADTGRLISSKRYNSEGKLLPSPGKPVRVPTADIADDTFVVPEGIKVLRPKTLGEFLSLRMKASKEAEGKGRDTAKGKDASVVETEEGES